MRSDEKKKSARHARGTSSPDLSGSQVSARERKETSSPPRTHKERSASGKAGKSEDGWEMRLQEEKHMKEKNSRNKT